MTIWNVNFFRHKPGNQITKMSAKWTKLTDLQKMNQVCEVLNEDFQKSVCVHPFLSLPLQLAILHDAFFPSFSKPRIMQEFTKCGFNLGSTSIRLSSLLPSTPDLIPRQHDCSPRANLPEESLIPPPHCGTRANPPRKSWCVGRKFWMFYLFQLNLFYSNQ